MSGSDKSQSDDELRDKIGQMLKDGLKTQVWPRADTSEMINNIVKELQLFENNNLEEKLNISGFTDYTVEADGIEQPCETCMYYLLHRKFCELPELMLPVEPEWSCRLWRI